MRALRVLGLDDGGQDGTGTNLVCEDPGTGEQFSVPCDDRLRAGARGDLSRLGQLEIEMESQLRPRDIQAKIRAGATVEQVAALAGSAVTKVERFAYPVLQERISVAERARKARPIIDGIPAGASVQDTVAATLAARGHDGVVGWDAFKDEQGWVLTLTWSAGRSENRAHWLFHPGPDGGTLSARDDAAVEIVDPALRAPRPLRPVRNNAVSNVLLDPTVPTSIGSVGPVTAGGVTAGAITASAVTAGAETADVAAGSSGSGEAASRSTHPAGSRLPAAQKSRFGLPASTPFSPLDGSVEDTVTDERAGANPVPARVQIARTGTDSPPRAMPTAPAPGRAPAATPATTPGAMSANTRSTVTATAVAAAMSGNETADAAAGGTAAAAPGGTGGTAGGTGATAAGATAAAARSPRRGQRPAILGRCAARHQVDRPLAHPPTRPSQRRRAPTPWPPGRTGPAAVNRWNTVGGPT
jgi:hypothetical protein